MHTQAHTHAQTNTEAPDMISFHVCVLFQSNVRCFFALADQGCLVAAAMMLLVPEPIVQKAVRK